MTTLLFAISAACNLWLLFLLFYDRIMETKLVRFFKGSYRVWQSLHAEKEKEKEETEKQQSPAGTVDIVGKSHFKMTPSRTNAAIPTQEAATSEKGIEVSEDDVTFTDEKASDGHRPAQVPADKLDETFTSIPASELPYSEDEPEDDTPDRPQASGNSFDEINEAVNTVNNLEATAKEQERAAKVFSDIEGTELYDRLMENSSEMSIRIKGLIEIRLKNPKKEFVIPEKLEDFNIRDFL